MGPHEEPVAGGGPAGGEDAGVGTGEQVGGVGGEGRQCVVDGPVDGVCLDAAQSLGRVPVEEGCGGYSRECLVHGAQGVPAIHGPGPREAVEPVTGQVVGFVLTGEGLPTVYVSGDTASLDAVKEIAERFAPVDTAILFAGAPRFPTLFDGNLIVLDSAQAAEATRILDAGRVVPVHHDSWAHFTEGRDDLEAAFTAAGLADRLDEDWRRRSPA